MLFHYKVDFIDKSSFVVFPLVVVVAVPFLGLRVFQFGLSSHTSTIEIMFHYTRHGLTSNESEKLAII